MLYRDLEPEEFDAILASYGVDGNRIVLDDYFSVAFYQHCGPRILLTSQDSFYDTEREGRSQAHRDSSRPARHFKAFDWSKS